MIKTLTKRLALFVAMIMMTVAVPLPSVFAEEGQTSNEPTTTMEHSEENTGTDDGSATDANSESSLDDVNHEIKTLKDNATHDPNMREGAMKRLKELHKAKTLLRAKMAIEGERPMDDQRQLPMVFFVRWGKLDGRDGENPCRDADPVAVKAALEAGETPECAKDVTKIEYKGTLSVNTGTLAVKEQVLFENNDQVTQNEGSSVTFTSNIAGHQDGLVLVYTPAAESSSSDELMITVSVGTFNETLSPAQILGRKDIGNGHALEIKRAAPFLHSLSDGDRNNLLEHKFRVQEKIGKCLEKLYRLRLLNKNSTALNSLEETANEAESYNFDDTTAAEVQSEIDTAIAALDDDATDEELKALHERLKARMEQFKQSARERKFTKNLIPFKDTDDNQWYTNYVSQVKNRGVISGYKDASGNELGEFRPANNITVAEILKVGLETGENGQSEGAPRLGNAIGHWAMGYVKKGEELNLNLVQGDVDLNRPATRGEVIRMILESLGISPDDVSSTDFSDVPTDHPHAKYIQYAKKLGIISGDDGKGTFRPDEPINRAETAKIADQTAEILVDEEAGE